MKHYDEMTIELFILKASEVEPEREEIERHIHVCRRCWNRYDALTSYYAEMVFTVNEKNQLVPSFNRRLSPEERQEALNRFRKALVLQRIEVALPIRAARWIVQHPYRAASGAVVMVSLIAILAFFLPRQVRVTGGDANPVIARFGGRTMFLQNQYGDTLDRITVSEHIAGDEKNYRTTALADVDGDGLNEVLWIDHPDADPENALRCRSLTQNRILWKVALNRTFVFPNQDLGTDVYTGRSITVDDFDGDGTMDVAVLALHAGMFPSYILLLNATNGTERGLYLHTGHLTALKSIDLDGDKRRELIACGVNNSLKTACLVVLDPRIVSGHSPLRERHRVTGLNRAYEKAYLQLPKSIVGEAVSPDAWNQASDIEFPPDSRTIKVSINDVTTDMIYRSTFYLFLDYNLSAVQWNTGDDYDASAKKLFALGRISHIPTSEYIAEYKKKLLYWNGMTWSSRPAVNKWYMVYIAAYESIPPWLEGPPI